MRSSTAVTQTAGVLGQLEQAMGPSCAAWARPLFDRLSSAHAVVGGHAVEHDDELLVCARACELDGAASGTLTAAGAARAFEQDDVRLLLGVAHERAPLCFIGLAHEIAWLVDGSSHFGERAVRAWLLLANHANSPFADVAIRGRALRRAARIALALGAASSAADQVDACAARHLDSANLALDVPLVRVALEARESFERGDPERCAALAIECAEREIAAQRDHRACALYRVAARALTRDSRLLEAEVLLTVRASVIAHIARRRRARGEAPWIVGSFLRWALEDLGTGPGASEFRVQVERELGELDDTCGHAEIARAWNACADALDFTPPRERLEFVARLPLEPTAPGNATWLEPLRLALRARRAREDWVGAWVDFANVCAASVLECARFQLALFAESTRAAIDEMLARDGSLGRERVELWRRGLRACVDGDALLGLALVVPQLDHALRADALTMLDPDTRFAAQLLLYDPDGWALHEQVSRGALPPRGASQPSANLVLWISLRVLDAATRRTHVTGERSNGAARVS